MKPTFHMIYVKDVSFHSYNVKTVLYGDDDYRNGWYGVVNFGGVGLVTTLYCFPRYLADRGNVIFAEKGK